MFDLKAHANFLDGVLERQRRRRQAIDPTHHFPPSPTLDERPGNLAGEPGEAHSKENVINYLADEETVRNDYTAGYNCSGVPGSDYILGAKDTTICEEYPALRRLMDLKKLLNDTHTHPPLYVQLPSTSSSSSSDIVSALAPSRFDVILITPSGTWDETAALPMRSISADPSFVFLWVGRGDQDGLEKGRECLAKWGFRRAEDIVWVKTTKARRAASGQSSDTHGGVSRTASESEETTSTGVGRGGLLASQKEHCLMGIRGTVRRSTDTRFVHCNVDTDVMLWEDTGAPNEPRFPPYLYTLIESFCLGTRRLHLNPVSASAASPPSVPPRRGWVTASPHDPPPDTIAFDSAAYPMMLPPKQDGRDILPFDGEIDNLRPKSPTRANKRGGHTQQSGQNRPNNARFDSRDSYGAARGTPPMRGSWQASGSGPRPPAASSTGGPPGSYQPRPAFMHAGYLGMPVPAVPPQDPHLLAHMYETGYAYGNDPQMAYLAAQMQQAQLSGYVYPQQHTGGHGVGFAGEMDPQQQYAYFPGGQVDQGAMYGYGYGQQGGQGQYQYQ